MCKYNGSIAGRVLRGGRHFLKTYLGVLAVALLLEAALTSQAQVLLNENFDSMGTAGTAPPPGWVVGYLGASGSQNRLAMTPYAGNSLAITSLPLVPNDGTVSSTAMALNLGRSGSSERALGNFPRTNPYGDHIMQMAVVNNTSLPLTGFALSYWGEQWGQNQGTASIKPERLRVLYSLKSPTDGFTYMGTSFDFNAPKDGPGGASGNFPIDGNLAENRAFITGSVLFDPGMEVSPGATFYVRWHDWNDNATLDHVLAIDDVTISIIPEPAALSLLLLSLGVLIGRRIRCK